MPRPSRAATGPTYRLVLQREETGDQVAHIGAIPESKIRPILEGLSALVQLAGFKRDLEGLLGRLGL